MVADPPCELGTPRFTKLGWQVRLALAENEVVQLICDHVTDDVRRRIINQQKEGVGAVSLVRQGSKGRVGKVQEPSVRRQQDLGLRCDRSGVHVCVVVVQPWVVAARDVEVVEEVVDLLEDPVMDGPGQGSGRVRELTSQSVENLSENVHRTSHGEQLAPGTVAQEEEPIAQSAREKDVRVN